MAKDKNLTATTPKPFVFVLMPFKDAFNDVYDLGIEAACKAAGAYCERVDKQIFEERVLDRIYNQIAKADIVVADMTGQNPNVFYEVGYAHALGKRTVLLTKDADDIPFDLKHFPHIVYGGVIKTLKDKLKERVRHYVQNPDKKELSPVKLDFYINGINIRTMRTVQVKMGFTQNMTVYFTAFKLAVSVQNVSDTDFIETSDMEFALVAPNVIGQMPAPSHTLPDDLTMHHLACSKRLMPQGWLHWDICVMEATYPLPTHFNCCIRVYTSTGMIEVPFTLVVL